jgi:hypothetical protein
MKPLRRQERETFTEIETSLGTENRKCPDAGAIVARLAIVQNQAQQIMIFPHEKTLSPQLEFARKNRQRWKSESSCCAVARLWAELLF